MEESKVIIRRSAYERMVTYGERFANREIPAKEWREVYGVLVGYIDAEKNVIVEDAVPILAGEGAGVKYETRHYAETAIIDEKIYNKTVQSDGREFFVGWWHTHPGFGFFFSETDTLTQLGYQQNNPYAVGIIYDPTERTPYDTGIEVLRLEDVSANIMSPYIFVDYELEDKDPVLLEIDDRLKELLPKLADISEKIDYLDRVLRRKKFASLQKEYGLLLERKVGSEGLTEDEIALENDALYRWDQSYLSKKFVIPKFRKKIEKMLAEAERKTDMRKKMKIINGVYTMLDKPRRIIGEIKEIYYKTAALVEIYGDYFDPQEKRKVEFFGERLEEYIDELNTVYGKTDRIAGGGKAKEGSEEGAKQNNIEQRKTEEIPITVENKGIQDGSVEEDNNYIRPGERDPILLETELESIRSLMEKLDGKYTAGKIDEETYYRKKMYLLEKIELLTEESGS